MPKSVVLAVAILGLLLVANIVMFFPAWRTGKWPVEICILLEGLGILVLIGLVFRKRLAWKMSQYLAGVFLGLVIFYNIVLARLGLDWWLFFGGLEVSSIVFLVALNKPSARKYFLNSSVKNV